VRTNRIFALFSVMLLIANFSGAVHGAAPPKIEDRIRAAIGFVEGQLDNTSSVLGFLHATVPGQPRRMYTEDTGLVALALSAYQETHYTQEFYSDLKMSAEFIENSQTDSGDFHEYYDLASQTWIHGGQLYYWNPYAMMGPAYAAFVITNQAQSEKTYWAGVIDRLRACADSWIPLRQAADGAIIFSFPDGSTKADVAANAALLASLIHIALFEYYWGDRNLATRYARWSEKIAGWLYSFQEKNNSTWGYGGFYIDGSRTIQRAFENGLILFGLNSYYKAASLLLSGFEPSIPDLRQMMIDWMVGFVERMFDSWGGAQYARTASGTTLYPKTVMAVSSVLQAAVDVWINIGPEVYWNDSQRLYDWITGGNELSVDLQSAANLAGMVGGFYEGIGQNGTMTTAMLALALILAFSLIVRRKSPKHGPSCGRVT